MKTANRHHVHRLIRCIKCGAEALFRRRILMAQDHVICFDDGDTSFTVCAAESESVVLFSALTSELCCLWFG